MGCSPWGCYESDMTERLHFHLSLLCIGEGNGNPLQCSCLENPGDGRAWWAAIYGVAQSQTRLKRFGSSRVQKAKVFEPRKMGVASGDPFASTCLSMYKKNVKPQSISLLLSLTHSLCLSSKKGNEKQWGGVTSTCWKPRQGWEMKDRKQISDAAQLLT